MGLVVTFFFSMALLGRRVLDFLPTSISNILFCVKLNQALKYNKILKPHNSFDYIRYYFSLLLYKVLDC